MKFTKEIFTDSDVERFWSKVDKNGPTPMHCPELGPCWIWNGGTVYSKGIKTYGKFSIRNDGKEYSLAAHRVSFLLHFDNITQPCICHKCDNKICVRPDHLFNATHSENSSDMVSKGRSASGDRNPSRLYPERYPKGENHPSRKRIESRPRGNEHWSHLNPSKITRGENVGTSKLTKGNLVRIKFFIKLGISQQKIASKFGVSQSAISRIKLNQSWKSS